MEVLKNNKVNLLILSLMLVILLFWSSQSQAAQEGDYTYTITTGKAQITGYTGAGGDVTIPSTLGGAPVTSIGFRAFSRHSELTSVTIPNSVIEIYQESFNNCTGLTSVTIGSGVTNILDSGGNRTGGLNLGAFEGCTKLTKVIIPDSVTNIGASAFKDCTELTSVTIGNRVKTIGGAWQRDWLLYPISAGAFSGCTNLTSVNIPDSVTSIGDNAFNACRKLTSVIIPDSVTSIGANAFEGIGLSSVKIGNSVTTIGDSAFSSCSKLTSVSIPDSVKSIGYRAFDNCIMLTQIDVETNNGSYSSQDGVLFDKTKATLIQYPAGKTGGYNITDSVINIGDYSFNGCLGLTSVTIPNKVISIGIGAFEGCQGLSSVTIPNSVLSIGKFAFYSSGLTTITILPGVTSIGDMAFRETRLTSVILPQTLESLGNNAFVNCYALTTVQFNSGTTIIPRGSIWETGRTIPYQAKIIGSDPSTAKDYALYYGNKFEALDIPDANYYVLFLNDSTASTANFPHGHIALLFYTTDQSSTGLNHYFSFGSGPNQSAETKFFDGNPLFDYANFLKNTGGGNNYDRSIVFKVCSRDLYTQMLVKARVLSNPTNKYDFLTNNCLDNALKVMALAKPDFFQGSIIDEVPNNAFVNIANYYGTGYLIHDVLNYSDFPVEIGLHSVDIAADGHYNLVPDYDYYFLVTAGEARITRYYGAGGVVEIPDTIGGFPVINIGSRAFADDLSLTSISIPQGITSIDAEAFEGCTGLTSIKFNSATTKIYDASNTIPVTTKIIGYDPSTAKDYATKYGRVFEAITTTDTTPPLLNVTSQVDNYTTTASTVNVSGSTEPGSTVTVGGNTVNTDISGNFNSTVTLNPGLNIITISSTDAAQNVTTVTRTVIYIDNSVVPIPDPNLEAALRSALNKPTGDITKTDMESLTTLSANQRNISNLQGLEYAKNLISLNLNFNQISDISPLANLTNLEILELGYNYNIVNISSLSNLTNLKELYLGYNKISDLSALAKLINLQKLWLYNNQITDLTPLTNIKELQLLHFDQNQISDLTPLQNLINLTSLQMAYNNIFDLYPIANLTKLTILSFPYNKVQDITALQNMMSLTNLLIYDNQISDISVLSDKNNINYLDMRHNPLYVTSLSIIDNIQSRGATVYYDPIDPTPPILNVTSPTDNYTTTASTIDVSGSTELGSTVTVGGNAVNTDISGNFNSTVTLNPGLNIITISSTDAAQNTSTITRSVFYNSTIAVNSVNLDKTSLSLVVGATDQLTETINPVDATNKKVTWSSDNPSVVTVFQSGQVTATGVGTANITVTTEDGQKSATCNVTVSQGSIIGDTTLSTQMYNINTALYINVNLLNPAKVTTKILDSNGQIIRTVQNNISKPAGLNTIYWDGKNSSGVKVSPGNYSYLIESIDATGYKEQAKGDFIASKSPVITYLTTLPIVLATNDQTANLQYKLDINSSKVSVVIYSSKGALVKTLTNSEDKVAGQYSVIWDGTDNDGKFVGDGIYTYKIDAVDTQTGTYPAVQKRGSITVEKTNPDITNITLSQNPFNMATASVNVSFTLAEDAYVTVKVKEANTNTTVRNLMNSIKRYGGYNIILWDGKDNNQQPVKGGEYYFVLTAVDGYNHTVTTEPIRFKASKTPVITVETTNLDLNINSNEDKASFQYQLDTAVDTKANVNVTIYNKQGMTVRTLTNELLSAGLYTIHWDGKDDSGNYVNDGTYTYRINAADPIAGFNSLQRSGSIIVEKGAPVISNISLSRSPYDPSSGSVNIGYNLSEESFVTIKVNKIVDGVNSEVRTLVLDAKKILGMNNNIWDGKDNDGQLVTGGDYEIVITAKDYAQPVANVTEAKQPLKVVRMYNSIFDTYNDSNLGINGYKVGFKLEGLQASDLYRVDVKLYNGTTLLATNISNSILSINPTLKEFSTVFDIDGTYKDDYWSYGKWAVGHEADLPDKAVITAYGNSGQVYKLENNKIIVTPQ